MVYRIKYTRKEDRDKRYPGLVEGYVFETRFLAEEKVSEFTKKDNPAWKNYAFEVTERPS